jgi:hypothetical protein
MVRLLEPYEVLAKRLFPMRWILFACTFLSPVLGIGLMYLGGWLGWFRGGGWHVIAKLIFLSMGWCWLLFLVAMWFHPERGSIAKARTHGGLYRWYATAFTYVAALLLPFIFILILLAVIGVL